ncbi:surface-adhesin E family protein [Brevundimonas sp.]|uniref:surface-adhesin E family protein n=1 Tax=Brevundimonas sp. TaxID=1871086 RepID=UPI003917F4B4
MLRALLSLLLQYPGDVSLQNNAPPPAVEGRYQPWLEDGIDDQGWTYVGWQDHNNSHLFLRRSFGKNQFWLREEYRQTPKAYKSIQVLHELDCDGGRLRVLQIDGFEDNNLRGEWLPLLTNRDWRYAAPDSLDGFLVDLFCDL